jgi:pheromone a factor receptor
VLFRIYFYRRELSTILSHSSTKKAHLYRLLIISLILSVAIIPLLIWGYTTVFREEFHAFSWTLIHSDWLVLKTPTGGELHDWFGLVSILFGYLVFFCFGVGTDAVEMYKLWGRRIGLGRWFPRLLAPRTSGTVSQVNSLATWKSGETTKASLLRNTSIAQSRSDSV